MPDGRRFSREVIAVDMDGCKVQRIARVHYYDNMEPVWDGGTPTHWRELEALPIMGARDAASSNTVREQLQKARAGVKAMLEHFTRTPSTLADSTARGRGHEALALIDQLLADGAFNSAQKEMKNGQ